MRNSIIKNVCAIVLFLLSVAETVVVAKFGSFTWYGLLLCQVSFCIGICGIRFAYTFAQMRLGIIMYRWGKSDDYDEEPNLYGILLTKLSGCFFLFLPIFVYAIYA